MAENCTYAQIYDQAVGRIFLRLFPTDLALESNAVFKLHVPSTEENI